MFHPYTYFGAVDLDKITDIVQRKAILAQIDEYGQTPMQLFDEAHPPRFAKSEVLATVFKSRKVRHYSSNALRESKDGQPIGIAAMIRTEKMVVVIGDDFCVSQHRWNRYSP